MLAWAALALTELRSASRRSTDATRYYAVLCSAIIIGAALPFVLEYTGRGIASLWVVVVAGWFLVRERVERKRLRRDRTMGWWRPRSGR